VHGSGAGWLIAAIVLTAGSIVIFARGLRGPAVGAMAADDAVTRWLATARVPGLTPVARGLAGAGSVPVTTAIAYGLVAALVVLRRFRHLLVFVASVEAADLLSGALQLVVHLPRPFGVPVRFGWGGFALPSVQIVYLCAVAVGVLHALVPASSPPTRSARRSPPARGLALPSQLRHALRAAGRDVHEEFLRLLPERPRPIRIQRWSIRRAALRASVALCTFLLIANVPRLVRGDFTADTALPGASLGCQSLDGLWVEAQSVPSAALLPCVRPLPVGWTPARSNAGSGRSVITLDNDRASTGALQLTLTAHCRTGEATPVPSPVSGVRRFAARRAASASFSPSWYDLFPGGCVTIQLHSQSRLAAIDAALPHLVMLILGYIPRRYLQDALQQQSGGRLHLT
jgi:hypothetical protein